MFNCVQLAMKCLCECHVVGIDKEKTSACRNGCRFGCLYCEGCGLYFLAGSMGDHLREVAQDENDSSHVEQVRRRKMIMHEYFGE